MMSLINNIFEQFYRGYGLSRSDIVKCTDIPYSNIRSRVLNKVQEERLYKFYYDIELIHSLLQNDDYVKTSGWFFSDISDDIPFSPADFYLQEGRKSVIDILISHDRQQYIKETYPQYVRGPIKFTTFVASDGELSISVNYEQFSA